MINEERSGEYSITVVVPTHNAIGKFERTIASLEYLENHLLHTKYRAQIVIVDDSSTDGTYQAINNMTIARPHWVLLSTAANTGSPSAPRNIGLNAASGEFVFFLDGDDEIRPDGIVAALDLGATEAPDIVRGPVVVSFIGTGKQVIVDKIPMQELGSADEMVEAVARNQSLNCSALWRKSTLIDNGIAFDSTTRMGEDLKFTAAGLSVARSIGYVSTPLFTYVRHAGGGNSAMHRFSGRELREIVESWDAVEDHFQKRGLSYLELHGDRTVNYAVQKIIRYHCLDEITEPDISAFTAFFTKHRKVLRSLKYADPHVANFVDALCVRGAVAFSEVVKPRLLIAGSDLKFILPAVVRLREFFDIRVDEWPTEVTHDVARSSKLLHWADYVWVEWLTSAAVWYSEMVSHRQRLVVRMHRYELGRRYGDIVSANKVDSFIAIAPHCLEDMVERFGYPRSKVRYIPNYYMVDDYERADPSDSNRVYRLAMIGAVPKRKGLLAALSLLEILRRRDDRYTLTILGKGPSDLPWVGNDPHEQQYFSACEQFIEDNDLTDSVEWLGWQDTRSQAKNFGFVLSMSEHEGSHVGPGEAFCAGNQGVFLNWRGAQFVYPHDQVFTSIQNIADHIMSMTDISEFNQVAQRGQEFMRRVYDIEVFINRVTSLFRGMV